MAGFYIHIPFCRQACQYCDFHFSVSIQHKENMVKALIKEIPHKAELFENDEIETLYFGGGTPSVLDTGEVGILIDTVKEYFRVSKDLEISFEANPGDLKGEYPERLKTSGVKRLSIGIQSFSGEDLLLMRRSHNATQAVEAINNAKEAGFKDINCDLIYGIPGMTSETWERNLETLMGLEIQHISAYHLTFEPGTVFDHWRKKNRIFPVQEEESLRQYEILKEKTEKAGFVHYEISNFALPGFFSKHNLTYWKNKKYIGIGPSAHSYDGKRRFWNISSNKKYMEMLNSNSCNYLDSEVLSVKDMYNEYML
ncbi:MAG: radical SAM family heme chaperone HemW, partial [Bacteroidota bacterium]